MTIQWTFIATFLYLELVFTFLLLLPFISPRIWQGLCHSRMFKAVSAKANTYFSVLILVLILFFLDSLREMWKYSDKGDHSSLDATLQMNMKLFRSQRNYFISGFSLFLSLVIRRLLTLLVVEADLLSENETAMKRAHAATESYEKLLRKRDQCESTAVREELSDDVGNLQEALKSAKFDLECTKRALLDVEEQARSTTEEYEALTQKHKSLLIVYAAVKEKRTGNV